MIDPKVFAELQNRGIVTVVGLKPEQFKNLDELKNYGLATSIATEEEYTNAIVRANYIESFLAEIAAGGKITLDADLVIDAPLVIEKDVELDLNGYSITSNSWDEDGDSNSYVFWVKDGKLTLNGEGVVKATDAKYSMAVWANGGDVEINGGTYKNGGDSCDLIYVSKKGNIVITNGEFIPAGPATGKEPGTKNLYTALNIKDANKSTCFISVKGGKFYNFDPANNYSENPQMSFVAPGYISVAKDDWYVVKEDEIVVDDNQ